MMPFQFALPSLVEDQTRGREGGAKNGNQPSFDLYVAAPNYALCRWLLRRRWNTMQMSKECRINERELRTDKSGVFVQCMHEMIRNYITSEVLDCLVTLVGGAYL